MSNITGGAIFNIFKYIPPFPKKEIRLAAIKNADEINPMAHGCFKISDPSNSFIPRNPCHGIKTEIKNSEKLMSAAICIYRAYCDNDFFISKASLPLF